MGDKVAKPQDKKYFKLSFRHLPESGYVESDFIQDITQLCQRLDLPPSSLIFTHFIEGKSSKRRGPISSTGFVTTSDESVATKVLKYFTTSTNIFVAPNKISPSVNVENPLPVAQVYYKQPDVCMAPYPKAFKFKEKPDKLSNTFEEDNEYKTFLESLNKPVETLPSAETLLDNGTAAVVHEDPKSTPLLVHLRKLGERRVLERNAAIAAKKKDKGGKKPLQSNPKDGRVPPSQAEAQRGHSKPDGRKPQGDASKRDGGQSAKGGPAEGSWADRKKSDTGMSAVRGKKPDGGAVAVGGGGGEGADSKGPAKKRERQSKPAKNLSVLSSVSVPAGESSVTQVNPSDAKPKPNNKPRKAAQKDHGIPLTAGTKEDAGDALMNSGSGNGVQKKQTPRSRSFKEKESKPVGDAFAPVFVPTMLLRRPDEVPKSA